MNSLTRGNNIGLIFFCSKLPCPPLSAPLDPGTVSKLSMFTSVPKGAVLSLHDVSNIYRVPLMMIEQNLPSMLLQRLRMGPFQEGLHYSAAGATDIADSVVIRDWKKLADSVDEPESECVIAVVGKYIDQRDACE